MSTFSEAPLPLSTPTEPGEDIKVGRKRALFMAFLAVNGATGLTLGSFGVLMPDLQRQYNASSTTISLGISFVLLMMGVLGPLIATVMAGISIRSTMVLGAALVAAGQAATAFGSELWQFLAASLFLIGPGVSLMGFIPATTLVSNWYDDTRGSALGIVTMPFGVFVVPIAIAQLNAQMGVRASNIALALAAALIGVILLAVRDRPGLPVAPEPFESGLGGGISDEPAIAVMPFLILCLGLGLLVFPGTIALVFTIPISGANGIPPQSGAVLLALQGGAGMAGALIFGFISDRFGPAHALLLNAVVHGTAWGLLTLQPGFTWYVPISVIIGACSGGIMGVFSALLSQRFGTPAFPRLIGLAGLLAIPFTFGAAPLAGYMRDLTGSYSWLIALNISALVLAVPMFVDWWRIPKQESQPTLSV